MINLILFLKQLNYGIIIIWDIYLHPERKQESSVILNNKPKSWKSKSRSKTMFILHIYIYLKQVYAHMTYYMQSWLATWGCTSPEGVKLS